MAGEKSRFDIDAMQKELLARGGVEAICQFYNVDPGECIHGTRDVRSKCFLACDKETGGRAMSFDTSKPRWNCYEYGCGKSGNLVTLCGYIKFGENLQIPVRGSQFSQVREDIKTMLGHESNSQATTKAVEPKESQTEATPVNTPLKDAEKETARSLVSLDEHCIVVPDESMNKEAASYMRSRPYLTPQACEAWRCGYLPQNAKTLLRGKFIYPVLDEQGDVLTWFGRDPQFEKKHRKWVGDGRPTKGEPNKHQFVKGFHRGLELFGQHRMLHQEVQEKLTELGILPVVEGPNDVIALDALDVPALGLCSNVVTAEQARKMCDYARALGIPVGLMLDADSEGDTGAKQSLALVAEHWSVRLVWSSTMHGGQFKGRQPESLTAEEWSDIRKRL